MPIPPGQLPPYAEEIQESRIGMTTGLDGASNVTRQFRVYTAKALDNPVVTIERLASALGGERTGNTYPRRSGSEFTPGHYWGDGSYVLYNWTILDHWPGTNVWVLQANYVPSYVAAIPRAAWTFRISSSLETEKVFVEKPWYNDAGTLVSGRGIGGPRYIPYDNTGPNTAAHFSAVSLARPGVPADLQLPSGGDDPRLASLPRYHIGADVPVRASVLTITKRIPAWNHAAAIQAINYLGHVNEDDVGIWTTSLYNGGLIFFAEAPTNRFLGIMLYSDLQIEPIIGEEGSVEPAFQVTMQFRIKPEGWQRKLIHTHEWKDDGVSAPVTEVANNNRIVEETFHIGDPAFLSVVIGAF